MEELTLTLCRDILARHWRRYKMDYDVVVCGAGPSGAAAAISAARSGAKVCLLERYGHPGGMATSGLVNPVAGHQYANPDDGTLGSLTGGIFREIAVALFQRGAFGSEMTPSAFDEQQLMLIYDRMLGDAGVDVIYHSWVAHATATDGNDIRISSIDGISKNGTFKVEGKTFVDATADADIAASAGCAYTVGRSTDNLTQAMTTNFRVGGVKKERMLQEIGEKAGHKAARLLVEPYFQKAREQGSLVFPYRDFVHFYDYPRPGVLHFNMTRITEVNGLRRKDLSYAEVEGRRQAFLLTDWLSMTVPLFEDAYVEKVATHVGVRETRHIEGLYTVSHEDIAEGRKFADSIARSCYFIDIHSPTGSGFDHEIAGSRGVAQQSFAPPKGDWYEVPYRSIVPRNCRNLLVPCRSLSATHHGAAAIRVMATMTAVGEAAGYAAAESARTGKAAAEIDGARLHGKLQYLEEEPTYEDIWQLRQPNSGQN